MTHHTTSTDVGEAIERSVSRNEIVVITVGSETEQTRVVDALRSYGDYDTDNVLVDAATYEVWGWTDSTPKNEQDWRVHVRVQVEAA